MNQEEKNAHIEFKNKTLKNDLFELNKIQIRQK